MRGRAPPFCWGFWPWWATSGGPPACAGEGEGTGQRSGGGRGGPCRASSSIACWGPSAATPPTTDAAAAAAIATVGPEGTAAIGRKLAELRRGSDDGAFSVVKGFRERGSKTPGFDLVEALVALKPDAGARHALTVACLLRALAHAGTTPAVKQMVLVAADVGGVFRPETLSRQLKLLGDRAVPALIEARRDTSPETRSVGEQPARKRSASEPPATWCRPRTTRSSPTSSARTPG